VSNACTVDLRDTEPTSQAPATGLPFESREFRPEKAFDLSRLVKIAGFAYSLAVSTVASMPDPWLLERMRRDAVVTVSIYHAVLGRFISRSNALRMSRQILEQAEQERLALAELEANRGAVWGN
jgi:hypothetical protein